MHNVISTPIDIPIIEPENWDQWWEVWKAEASMLMKVSRNHNKLPAMWKGFDLWVKEGINAEEITSYRAKNINRPDLFPAIFKNLDLFPIDIDVVRIVSSLTPVYPHADHKDKILSVRSLIYDTNPSPTFYFVVNDEKKYQALPKGSNSWMYWDYKTKHGTDWFRGHHKILIMYFGKTKSTFTEDDFLKNAEKFKDCAITQDNV